MLTLFKTKILFFTLIILFAISSFADSKDPNSDDYGEVLGMSKIIVTHDNGSQEIIEVGNGAQYTLVSDRPVRDLFRNFGQLFKRGKDKKEVSRVQDGILFKNGPVPEKKPKKGLFAKLGKKNKKPNIEPKVKLTGVTTDGEIVELPIEAFIDRNLIIVNNQNRTVADIPMRPSDDASERVNQAITNLTSQN